MNEDLKRYKDLAKQVQGLYDKALSEADSNDSSIRIGKEVWVTKREAERMKRIINKQLKVGTMEELAREINKDYDKIPFIVGLTEADGALKTFQEQIESIKD